MKKAIMATIAAVGFAGSSASAQLIAADSFDTGDYSAGGLNGQNPNINPGWTGAGSASWSVGSANLQADAISLTNSATAYDDGSTGKGRYIASSFDFYRAGHHRMDNYTAADTYYMSFFVNPGGSFLSSGSREHAVVGFTNFVDSKATFENTNSNNVFGLFAGFRGEDAGAAAGEADLILRARGASGDLEDTVLLSNAQNETYHVIYKLEVNASGGTDQVSWWVNPSDLTDESSLTSSAAAAGSVGTFSMDTNFRIDRLSVISNDWARSMFWDETRFGYDLDSVTGVPAPGAAAVLGLAGLAAARRRRA